RTSKSTTGSISLSRISRIASLTELEGQSGLSAGSWGGMSVNAIPGSQLAYEVTNESLSPTDRALCSGNAKLSRPKYPQSSADRVALTIVKLGGSMFPSPDFGGQAG